MQAVILSFDSLAANSIGCYGNDWIETPHFDQLASMGIVFDRCFADTVGITAGHSWATGQHSLDRSSATLFTPLGPQLCQSGISTALITTSQTGDWHKTAGFDRIQIVEGHEDADAQPDQVPIASIVKAALSKLAEPANRSQPRLLWLHAPSPSVPPVGFDSLYFEDFEERGEFVSELPDELKAIHPAIYAGSVSLIDHWLGVLLAALEESSRTEPTLVIVTASQGHLWHQHRSFDSDQPLVSTSALCDQKTRVPLVIRVSGDPRFGEYCGVRSTRLVQSLDLVPTLVHWFGMTLQEKAKSYAGQSWLHEATETVPARLSLWIADGVSDALRTDDWLCIRQAPLAGTQESSSAEKSQFMLFCKPEDIWDVNDVAGQQADLLGDFSKQLNDKKFASSPENSDRVE